MSPKTAWTPKRIKALRKKYNETQDQFARRIGVSWLTVNRWENGHSSPSRLAEQALSAISKGK